MPIHDGREMLLSGRRRHLKQPRPFLPPYFTSSQSFFLFFLFAGFLLLFVFSLRFIPFQNSAGLVYWNPWSFAFFSLFWFSEQHWFSSLSPSLVSNDGFVFLQRELVKQDCFVPGGGDQDCFISHRTYHPRPSKRQEEMRRLACHFHRYPYTYSHRTSQPKPWIAYLSVFLHLFVLRFGKGLTLGGRTSQLFSSFSQALTNQARSSDTTDNTHKTQHHSQIGTQSRGRLGMEQRKQRRRETFTANTIFLRSCPLFQPPPLLIRQYLGARRTHLFPLLICRMLFLIDQDDHGYFWL